MRVGIVTQPLAANYGGLLQNWALQQVLLALGHTPITIDVGVRYPFARFALGWTKTALKKALGARVALPRRPYHGRAVPHLTGSFVRKNISTTKPLARFSPSVIDAYHIQALVVGSDQVWRPRYNLGTLPDMFLDFAKGRDMKKVAYAASFGVDCWEFTEEQTAACATLAKEFSAISVRESSAVGLCRDHLGVKAVHVLDPTLLISADQYERLCASVPRCTAPYMAVYCLDASDEKRRVIEQVSEQLNLEVRYFSAHRNVSLSVEQWLATIRDARLVVTDSFHGTVFSVIFKKQFLIMANDVRGNARLDSLLSLLGLHDRQELSSCLHDVDWPKVADNLDKWKTLSLSFLKQNL